MKIPWSHKVFVTAKWIHSARLDEISECLKVTGLRAIVQNIPVFLVVFVETDS